MFRCEFACPSCGVLIQPANPVRIGREVQCYACRTTFVVTEQIERPPPSSRARAQPASADVIHWTNEAVEDYEPAPSRPAPSRQRKRLRPKDKLEGAWIAIIWGSLAVPLIGNWIIVLLSSVMYYVWRNECPKKARSINRHGWMAWLVGMLIWYPLWIIANRDRWETVLNQGPLIATERKAGTISNRERLVGTWEMQADEGRAILEFGSGGRFQAVTYDPDGAKRLQNIGTWECLSENDNQMKIRTVASDAGGPYTNVWDLIFLDDNSFTRAERQDQVFHRR